MEMKVFTVDGVGKCSIRKETIPELIEGDVLIKVAYTGICGTDMSFYTGETSFIKKGWVQYPVRVGHEYSGVVEALGPGFSAFKKGDRVFSDTGVSCGVCEGCIKGTGCKHGRAIGTLGNHYPGAMAEYMLIHQRHVHPMPKGMTFKNAALIEPASIAYNHMDCNKVLPTSEVAVMGTGPIGLAAVPMYKAMGAAKVIMIGRQQFKLDVAKQLGATHLVNAKEVDPVKAVMDITEGRGCDQVLECAGSPAVVQPCLDMLASGGVVGLLSFYEVDEIPFDIDKYVTSNKYMSGVSRSSKVNIAVSTAHLLTSRGIDLSPLITHECNFDGVVNAYETIKTNKSERIKYMVHCNEDLVD